MARRGATCNVREHALFQQRQARFQKRNVLAPAHIDMDVKLAIEIEADCRRFGKIGTKQFQNFIKLIRQAFCVGLCRKNATIDRIYTCIF